MVGIEVGEECDGKHMTPEDYGAIYIQVADAVHKLTPSAKLGGPIFEGVDKDITLWADDEGRTSWMERFVDYLKAHGHLKDLSFMSFEHYPFMINGFTPPNDWASLYLEPGIMKHVLHMWRAGRRPSGCAADHFREWNHRGAKRTGLPGRDWPLHLGVRCVWHIL